MIVELLSRVSEILWAVLSPLIVPVYAELSESDISNIEILSITISPSAFWSDMVSVT